MWHSVVSSLFIACTLASCGGVGAQFNDDLSMAKLQLQDLENEQNRRDYQRQELERHRQQQPLLPPRAYNNGDVPPMAPPLQYRQSSHHSPFRHVPQSVRPLEQVISPVKPLHPVGFDYAAAATNSFSNGLNPLPGNSLSGDAADGTDDSDIVTFSHAVPSLPLHLRRPQLELLSGGGAGYALMAADVLVPPFREYTNNNNNGISDERRRLPQLPADGHYSRPLPAGGNRVPPNYPVNEASAQLLNENYLTNNELPAPAEGTIEYAGGYPSQGKFPMQRPNVQYGSPQAVFRRPALYGQSNQLVYAPVRSEGGPLGHSPGNIPYPPSFISITTQRPETAYENSRPPSVLPLGRSLGYKNQFRPSPVDPVPDLFANRQAKSLLDSYIPSWIVEKALREQRNGAHGYNGYSGYFKRSLVAPNRAQARNDVVSAKVQRSAEKTEKKTSPDGQVADSSEELLMMA